MFERFTEGARTALVQAQAEAHARSDDHLGGEHLLLGLLRPGTGAAADILAGAGLTPDVARRAVDDLYGPPPAIGPGPALAAIGIDLDAVNARLTETFGPGALDPRPTPYDDDAKAALVAAVTAAEDREVGTEHVLLGLLTADGSADGRAAKLLEHLGADVAALAEQAAGRS